MIPCDTHKSISTDDESPGSTKETTPSPLPGSPRIKPEPPPKPRLTKSVDDSDRTMDKPEPCAKPHTRTPSVSMSTVASQPVDVQLDRSNDKVYQATTSVVRAVMDMTKGVHQARAEQYVDLVKSVGIQLKELLSNVDAELKLLPNETHHEIEMAHKVLSSDMAELIRTMRLAQQYSSTPLDVEYRKNMLKAAHVLAMDSKNLLDAVDNSRRRSIQHKLEASTVSEMQSSAENSQAESTDAGDSVFDGDITGEEASIQRLTLSDNSERCVRDDGVHVVQRDTAEVTSFNRVEANQSSDLDRVRDKDPPGDGVLDCVSDEVEDDPKNRHSPACNKDIENVLKSEPLEVR